VDKGLRNGSAEEIDHEMAFTLFHVTRLKSAANILRDGFIDSRDTYMTDQYFTGVWLSDRPLDANEGASGDTVLAVTFSVPLSALAQYEWIEEGKTHREWLVPAAVIRQLASVSKHEN
jgi:hypothetical protein